MIKTHHAHLLGATLAGLFSSQAQAQVSYQHYRFEPVALYAGGGTIQLSEFAFSNNETRLNLIAANPELETPPANGQNGTSIDTVPVVVTGGSRPVTDNEGALKIIDGSLGTKWLSGISGGEFDSRFLHFDFAAPTPVDSYTFATGGDTATFPNRNPVSWNMWGRNSEEEEWILIDRVINHPSIPTNSTFQQDFPLTGHFPPEAPVFTLSHGAEVIIRDGGTTAFDWYVIDDILGEPDSLTIDPPIGAPNLEVAEFFHPVTPPAGADTVYTLTATKNGLSSSTELTVRSVAGGTANHQFYRFTPVAARRNLDGYQLSEFAFFHNNEELNLLAVNNPGQFLGSTGTEDNLRFVVVTNPGGSVPADAPEGAVQLVDGNTATKFLDRRSQPVIFGFEEPVAIDSYRFTTANDNESRDPVRWTLEGSDDGETWTLIDNVTAFPYPTTDHRHEHSQIFPLPGPSLKEEIHHIPVFHWNGELSQNYAIAYNWSPGSTPDTGDEVIITEGAAVHGGNLERLGKTTLSGEGALTVNGRLLNRGEFSIEGGTLTQNGEYFIAGINLPGTIRHSAGTVNSTHSRGWFLSDNAVASGSRYLLSGTGILNVTSTGNGNTGPGIGGTLLHNVHLGKAGTDDVLEISGGQANFTSTNNNFVLLSRTATMRISGGESLFRDYTGFIVGFEGAGGNLLEISGGSVSLTGTPLIVGSTSSGSVVLSGGHLTLDGTVSLGQSNADGVFTISGGTLTAADIVSGPRGALHFQGGEILLAGDRRSILEASWFHAAEGTSALYIPGEDQTIISVGDVSETPFSIWAANSGLPEDKRGPGDDPDRDGIPNILEFALAGLPDDGSSPGTSSAIPTEGGMVLTIAVRNNASFAPDSGRLAAIVDGIRYEVQGSLDLATWDAGVEALDTVVPGDLSEPGEGWELRSFRLTGDHTQGFLRVQVTEVP